MGIRVPGGYDRLIPLASSSHLNLPIMWPVELGVLNRWVPTHPTFLVFMKHVWKC